MNGVRFTNGSGTSSLVVRGAGCLCAVLLLLSGCALSRTWVRPDSTPVPPPPQDLIDTTLLLVGDAGEPDLDHPEPVLSVLRQEAAQAPQRTVVVFLGDNIYPDGLPGPEATDRARAEAILMTQVEAVQQSGAQAIFLPGNHDYHIDGRAGVRREAEAISALGNSRVTFHPRAVCPGPESLDYGSRLRLIVFDSTWWIRQEFSNPDSSCSSRSEEEFLQQLEASLTAGDDRHVVVVTHHPVASHGWHGGFYTWRDHIFPLTRAKSWLWLPLPVIGSIYPVYRMAGGYRQDIPSSGYQHMLHRLQEAFRKQPPLALAAGHDHNLQVLAGRYGVDYALVSGSGSISRPDPVSRGDDTYCASPFAGFLRLDFLRDGRVRLEVVEVHEGARVQRPWSSWIAGDAVAPTP